MKANKIKQCKQGILNLQEGRRVFKTEIRRLEEKIRKLENPRQIIDDYCSDNVIYSSWYAETAIHKDILYVLVPLPQANTTRTFAAFDWVKTFCRKFDCKEGFSGVYPIFNSECTKDYPEYIVIKVNGA